MNAPHVVALYYKLKTESVVAFENTTPLEDVVNGFNLRLEDNILKVEPLDHFASQEDAQVKVQSILRSWEIDFELAMGQRGIAFEFDRAEMVDRKPPKGSHQIIETKGRALRIEGFDVTLCHVRRQYPKPPTQFVASPNVETIWGRFTGYKAGREPLPSMAYMVLTVLEISAGGRPTASKQYNIDQRVLKTLGTLSSDIGDAQTGRKSNVRHKRTHTPQEIAWLEAVVIAITRRLGEYAFDPTATLPKLTMAKLPLL